jgi:hypothetical protein
MFPKQEMCLSGNTALMTCMEFVLCDQLLHLLRTKENLADEDATQMRRNISSMTLKHSAFTVTVCPSVFSYK